MKIVYLNYYGQPVKLHVDDEELPETCEFYDEATDTFVERSEMTPEVWFASGSYRISEKIFLELLAKVRAARSSEAKRS